jgi:hypothetical protein
MYIPDHTIVRRLRSYDDKLSVRWIPRRERWGIYRSVPSHNNLYDRQVLVKIVANDDKSYRPLDERIITHMMAHDMQRLSQASFNAYYDEIEKSEQRARERERRAFLDDTEQITKEIAPQAIKEMEEDSLMGTRNIPKEDARAMITSRYGEEEADAILSC